MFACQDSEKYLDAFLDGALGIKESLDMQEHMHSCTRCADRADAKRILNAFVRQCAVTPPPAGARKRRIIRNAMRSSPSTDWWKHRKVMVHLRGIAIGMAAAIILLVLRPISNPTSTHDLMQQISREAMLTYDTYTNQPLPLEVANSNDTSVVEWAKSRMGSRLRVPSITDKESRLLGGRLCRVLDRKSAVFIYQRNSEDVLLFAFKGDPITFPTKNTVQAGGYAFHIHTISGNPVAIWQRNDLTYSLVGNLDRDELLQLASTIDYQ